MIINSIEELEIYCDNTKGFYIFGNGYAKGIINRFLSEKNLDERIKAIITTEAERNNKSVTIAATDIPMYERRNSTIVICTTEKWQKEITEYLKILGYTSIATITDNLLLSIQNYLKVINKEMEEVLRGKIVSLLKDRACEEEKQDCDIMFFSVPYWDVYSPFSAVPSLIAYLRERDVDVSYIDLGIKSFYESLNAGWEELSNKFFTKSYYRNTVKQYINCPYSSYDEYCDSLWFFMDDYFKVNDVKKRYDELNEIQKGIIDEFYTLILVRDILPVNFNIQMDLETEIEKRSYLSLLRALLKCIYKVPNNPKMIGISVTGTGQFMHACKLAVILKEVYDGVPIVCGGSCIDYYLNSLFYRKVDIYKYFDYVMVGEGESTLYKLIKSLGNAEVQDLPNLAFIYNNTVKYNKQVLENVEELPVPDYSDLELDEYLSPYRILPYQASRGCHYGYCAFCNHDEKYRHNYRMKSASKVVYDLLSIIHKYDVKYFQFVDEAIRPDHFYKIISEMEKYKEFTETKWFYYSRVSMKYNAQILDRARKVGCEMVMFGVETYNQRLLNFIKKGITVDTSRYCLKLFHDHGIKTYEWLMCNLPSETEKEMMEDYINIKEHMKYVDAIGMGMFMLEPNTDMYKQPEIYNIVSINNNDPLRFQSTDGVNIINKERVIEKFINEIYPDICRHYFAKDRYSVFFNKIGENGEKGICMGNR